MEPIATPRNQEVSGVAWSRNATTSSVNEGEVRPDRHGKIQITKANHGRLHPTEDRDSVLKPDDGKPGYHHSAGEVTNRLHGVEFRRPR